MAKRLIDANAADVEQISCYYGDHCYLEDVKAWLDEQPTVDAVEVVHGYWIIHADDLFPTESTMECSVCHEEESLYLYNDNYCPNCGAKMDGGTGR